MTASPCKDPHRHKLSLTVGYAEFLVTNARLPDDLREYAQRAMDAPAPRSDERAQGA